MKNFVEAKTVFQTNDIYYRENDLLYIENEHWKKFDEMGLVGKNKLQSKYDYRNGGI